MIPEMTHELGRHWRQPSDIRDAPISDTEVLLTQRQFDELPEYSASMPSGVYEGKCWKREEYQLDRETGRFVPIGVWYLGFYGLSDRPECVSNNWRKILIA